MAADDFETLASRLGYAGVRYQASVIAVWEPESRIFAVDSGLFGRRSFLTVSGCLGIDSSYMVLVTRTEVFGRSRGIFVWLFAHDRSVFGVHKKYIFVIICSQ